MKDYPYIIKLGVLYQRMKICEEHIDWTIPDMESSFNITLNIGQQVLTMILNKVIFIYLYDNYHIFKDKRIQRILAYFDTINRGGEKIYNKFD